MPPPVGTAPAHPRSTYAQPRPTVADAMITEVKLSGVNTTVRDLRALFADGHVHAAVIVEDGFLLAVVDRLDVQGDVRDDTVAVHLGSRQTRVIAPDADLERARQLLLASGRRRLAVVSADGRFHGLLCLKRTRQGFCSDDDVSARGCGPRH